MCCRKAFQKKRKCAGFKKLLVQLDNGQSNLESFRRRDSLESVMFYVLEVKNSRPTKCPYQPLFSLSHLCGNSSVVRKVQ